METQILKGIVLSSCDYKEKDKLVELFTVECGKITAVLKGCKASKAKLKFAFQPFCFAEFTVIRIGSHFQITDAMLIDSFFDLTKDMSKYYLANLVLEVTNISTEKEEQNARLFLSLINCLKYICYEDLPPYLVVLKYCIYITEMLGYKIDFLKCTNCGQAYVGKIYLDLNEGSFVCNACKSSNSVLISNQAFAIIKIVYGTNYERLNTIKIAENVVRESILILCKNLEHRLQKKIHSQKLI